jgi:phosphoserine phosphatase
MTTSSHETEQFSGLILLTGEDKPGLAHALFTALSPFSVAVIDLDQIIIKDRLILTLQISLNPAHQNAIEEDLNLLASDLAIDIAAVFSSSPALREKPACLTIKLSSEKLHPKHLSEITQALLNAGANIEDLTRTATFPLEVTIKLSGISQNDLQTSLAVLQTSTEFSLTIGA